MEWYHLKYSAIYHHRFGGQPVVVLNPFQNALQLAGNELLRMNMTTAQAVHDGNCTDGCS
jgi:hypothetical protein